LRSYGSGMYYRVGRGRAGLPRGDCSLSHFSLKGVSRIIDALAHWVIVAFRFHVPDALCQVAGALAQKPLAPSARAALRTAAHRAVSILNNEGCAMLSNPVALFSRTTCADWNVCMSCVRQICDHWWTNLLVRVPPGDTAAKRNPGVIISFLAIIVRQIFEIGRGVIRKNVGRTRRHSRFVRRWCCWKNITTESVLINLRV